MFNLHKKHGIATAHQRCTAARAWVSTRGRAENLGSAHRAGRPFAIVRPRLSVDTITDDWNYFAYDEKYRAQKTCVRVRGCTVRHAFSFSPARYKAILIAVLACGSGNRKRLKSRHHKMCPPLVTAVGRRPRFAWYPPHHKHVHQQNNSLWHRARGP